MQEFSSPRLHMGPRFVGLNIYNTKTERESKVRGQESGNWPTVRVLCAWFLGERILTRNSPSLATCTLFLVHRLFNLNVCPTKKRARENLEAARLRATPVGELQARYRGGKSLRRTTPSLDGPSPFASQVSSRLPPFDELEDDSNDEEEGRGQGLVPMRGESRMSPVATCREQSTSVWLHFPHVELVILFFAFEGAVASFASAMRHSECPEIFYTALTAMVSAF